MNEQEFSELAERVQQIHEMTLHPGWSVFKDRASHEIGLRQELVLAGRLKTYDEYRYETGFVNGMLFVFKLPIAVAEEFQQLAIDREQAKQNAA